MVGVWYGMTWYGRAMVWDDMVGVWHGMVGYGMAWHGMIGVW